jgi:hypothetical protein
MPNMMQIAVQEVDTVSRRLFELGADDLAEMLNDRMLTHRNTPEPPNDNEALRLAADYPAYWKALPAHWAAIDTYRIDDLFPLSSSRLYHTRKKLLVPGCRTGGKTVYQDLKEAHRTLGAWLAEQPEHNA